MSKKYKKRTVKKNYKAIRRLQKAPELKTTSIQVAEQDIDSDGNISFINTIAQGDGRLNRDGSSVTLKMIHIRGWVKEQGAGSDGICRLIVFRMKNKLPATTLATTDLMASNNVVSMYNQDNRKNFKIYYDETFPIDTATHSNVPFKITIKPNCKVTWNNDAAGNENDCTGSAIYFYNVSDIATGVDCPHVYANIQLSYTDS